MPEMTPGGQSLDLQLTSRLPSWAPSSGPSAVGHPFPALPFLGPDPERPVSCPDHHQHVGHTEAAHTGHDNWVVFESGKELTSLEDIDGLGITRNVLPKKVRWSGRGRSTAPPATAKRPWWKCECIPGWLEPTGGELGVDTVPGEPAGRPAAGFPWGLFI